MSQKDKLIKKLLKRVAKLANKLGYEEAQTLRLGGVIRDLELELDNPENMAQTAVGAMGVFEEVLKELNQLPDFNGMVKVMIHPDFPANTIMAGEDLKTDITEMVAERNSTAIREGQGAKEVH